jgi:hypothetical protein
MCKTLATLSTPSLQILEVDRSVWYRGWTPTCDCAFDGEVVQLIQTIDKKGELAGAKIRFGHGWEHLPREILATFENRDPGREVEYFDSDGFEEYPPDGYGGLLYRIRDRMPILN